jgi:hypothetical protein
MEARKHGEAMVVVGVGTADRKKNKLLCVKK